MCCPIFPPCLSTIYAKLSSRGRFVGVSLLIATLTDINWPVHPLPLLRTFYAICVSSPPLPSPGATSAPPTLIMTLFPHAIVPAIAVRVLMKHFRAAFTLCSSFLCTSCPTPVMSRPYLYLLLTTVLNMGANWAGCMFSDHHVFVKNALNSNPPFLARSLDLESVNPSDRSVTSKYSSDSSSCRWTSTI